MKKLENTLLNMTVVLTATAIVTGGLLAFVNSQTETARNEVKEKALKEGIVKVMGNPKDITTTNDTVNKDDKTFIVHKVANAAGEDLGVAIESSTMGFGGELKVLTGFDSEGNILGYTILGHSETPGLGAKAGFWFQKDGKGSIIGKNPGKNNLTVSKDGGEVDAITASTITSRAFLKAVNEAYSAIESNGAANADATAGATKAAQNDSTANEAK